ncbi:hypothetical protein M153_690003551 [Pseudoloma neurophilia]|uniref:Uncharacterized protein n=1 Tax=Pseudoloma neurophilia TaxID=146866 RepID=A0A0R0M4E8_9MICR|nr:hypothetical protein M153_690003551 [Pseudoloma neurophilia]
MLECKFLKINVARVRCKQHAIYSFEPLIVKNHKVFSIFES